VDWETRIKNFDWMGVTAHFRKISFWWKCAKLMRLFFASVLYCEIYSSEYFLLIKEISCLSITADFTFHKHCKIVLGNGQQGMQFSVLLSLRLTSSSSIPDSGHMTCSQERAEICWCEGSIMRLYAPCQILVLRNVRNGGTANYLLRRLPHAT